MSSTAIIRAPFGTTGATGAAGVVSTGVPSYYIGSYSLTVDGTGAPNVVFDIPEGIYAANVNMNNSGLSITDITFNITLNAGNPSRILYIAWHNSGDTATNISYAANKLKFTGGSISDTNNVLGGTLGNFTTYTGANEFFDGSGNRTWHIKLMLYSSWIVLDSIYCLDGSIITY